MPEPVTSIATVNKEEEKLNRKEEQGEEKIQLKTEAPVISIQREAANEDEVQAKLFSNTFRQPGADQSVTSVATNAPGSTNGINRKSFSISHIDLGLYGGRSPPQTSAPFEQSLSSSKGGGSALPSATQQFMGSRFNADFSTVRVHTGSYAVSMSQDINAQAFTYGSDIYFASNKYSPESSAGATLLAHELSHTIQQGSVKQLPITQAQQTGNKNNSPAIAVNSIDETPVHDEPANENAGKTGEQEIATPGAAKGPGVTPPPGKEAGDETVEPVPPQATGANKKSAPVIEIHMPEPPADLNAASKKRLRGSQGRASQSAAIHSVVPDAGKNVTDARGSVEEPKEEINAKVGEELVVLLGERPPPSPEILDLCKKIREVIRKKRPPDEDSLVDADPEASAKEAGGEVKQTVDDKVENVETNYDDLQETPDGKKEKQEQEVVPPEETVDSPSINASNAVPDAVPAKNISLDEDVASSDQKINEAGMTSEPAKLVQDGPIGEARNAQGELSETAAQDPAAVEAAQQQALAKAGEEMNAIQDKALQALLNSRSKTIAGVGTQQTGMKESEEDKRKRVGELAQKKFNDAQAAILPILAGISKGAMAKWEEGVKAASGKFKATLNKVKTWIDKRHSGVKGFFVSIGDAIGGLPGWVTTEYDQAEKLFGDEVCELIIAISTEVNTVIASCQLLIDNTQKEIAKLFHDSFGELDEWANQELKLFDKKIQGLHDKVEDTKNKFNKDLADKASKSVQDVREEIHALREKAKGLIGRIADAIKDFIDDPAKFILEGLLRILGIPIPAFWRLVNKIKTVIGQIAADPMTFANNLMESLSKGFGQFIDNFTTHLKQGFLLWLTSGFGSVGVQLPPDFSLKSMITFFLQLMGINWERIRKLLVKHIGEQNVEHIEKAYELVAGLIEKGPEGIIEFIKDLLDPKTLLDQIMDAVIDFVVELIVKRVAIELLKLFNPVGAILKAIELIYSICKWIFENAKKIFTLVESIVNGVGNIMSGNIAGMAAIIENSLTILIAPIIDFLAGLIGLGDLPEKVAGFIKKFQKWIEGILDKAIGWLATQAKKLLKKLGIGKDKKEDEAGKPSDTEVGKVIHFTAGGEHHKIWVNTSGSEITLMMASDKPEPIGKKMKTMKEKAPKTKKEKVENDVAQILSLERTIIADAAAAKQKIKNAQEKGHTAEDNRDAKTADDRVEREEERIKLPTTKSIEIIHEPDGTEEKPFPLFWPTLLSHPPVASTRTLKKVANAERDTDVTYIARQKEILYQFAAKEKSAKDPEIIKELRRDLKKKLGIKGEIKEYTLDGHLHHVHPLFLNGEDSETNLIMLNASEHLRGHDILRRQTGAPSPPVGMPVEIRDLYDSSKHPNNTYYKLRGDI